MLTVLPDSFEVLSLSVHFPEISLILNGIYNTFKFENYVDSLVSTRNPDPNTTKNVDFHPYLTHMLIIFK